MGELLEAGPASPAELEDCALLGLLTPATDWSELLMMLLMSTAGLLSRFAPFLDPLAEGP